MADTALVFGDDDLDGQIGFEGDVDVDVDISHIEDEYLDDAAASDKDDDADFLLDNSIRYGDDENKDEEDDRHPDPEYQEASTGEKRKHASTRVQAYKKRRSFPYDNAQAESSEPFILEEIAQDPQEQASRASGTFGRGVDRKKGDTLPAYHRKVTVSLDEVDLLMLEMREKRFSDQQISEKLAKDCQVKYNVKTISTRISRIRLAQAENMDFQLKEGYKEWQFEDDQILIQAYALANIEVNYEIERVRAWRFRKVAEYMRRLKKDALFSANACRERYSALIEGTARIPSEVADDPEASHAELAAFRKEREKARRDEEAKKSSQTTLRKRRKDEAAAHAAQRAEEAANKRAAKEAEKADRARKRAEKAQEKAQSALRIQKEKKERHSRAKKQATMVANEDEAVTREAEPPTEKPKAPIKTTLILASKSNLPKKPALPFSSKTPDPRSFLSLPDLRRLCAARGFRVSGKTKKMLLSDIQNEERKWKLSNLKAMCKSKGLAASGTKPLLRHRLALSSANEFVLSDSEMEATQVESEGEGDGKGDNGERDGDDEEEIADDMSLGAE